MMLLPKSRTVDIVVQDLGKEVLIYDLNIHKAFNLNETSSIIYKACDGQTAFAELRAKHHFSDDLIFLALDKLKKENLLEASENYISPFAGMTRREVVRKVGLASVVALPAIYSLVAPTAAHSQSIGSLSFTCSNPGAGVGTFCAGSVSACSVQAKTQCATCAATGSGAGLCSANGAGSNITCTCGGTCSNPGAPGGSFCVATFADCGIQSRTQCANCSATASNSGLCSANPPGSQVTCTCT